MDEQSDADVQQRVEYQKTLINVILNGIQQDMPVDLFSAFNFLRPKILEKLLVHYPCTVFDDAKKMKWGVYVVVAVSAFETAMNTKSTIQRDSFKYLHKYVLDSMLGKLEAQKNYNIC